MIFLNLNVPMDVKINIYPCGRDFFVLVFNMAIFKAQ